MRKINNTPYYLRGINFVCLMLYSREFYKNLQRKYVVNLTVCEFVKRHKVKFVSGKFILQIGRL